MEVSLCPREGPFLSEEQEGRLLQGAMFTLAGTGQSPSAFSQSWSKVASQGRAREPCRLLWWFRPCFS